MLHFAIFLPAASAAGRPLTLQVSSDTAPPGGWAQIKIWASTPALIASGQFSIDLDPSIFGPPVSVAVFSATGDQIGYAQVNGEHLDVIFSSPSAGIGQLPGLPVFAISVPVLASAAPGKTASVAAAPATSFPSIIPAGGPPFAWTDSMGNAYTVTVNQGTFTVGGSLSVQSVTPGGGVLPAGSIVHITGTGFASGDTVTIDGVSLSNVGVLNSNQIDVTLGGAAEMTGRHLRVTNPGGGLAEDYIAPPSAPANAADFQNTGAAGLHAILPATEYAASQMYNPFVNHGGAEYFAIFNPNSTTASVTLEAAQDGQLLSVNTYSVPAGQLYFIYANPSLTGLFSGFLWTTASEPVRFITLENIPNLSEAQFFPAPPQLPTASAPPIQIKLPASPTSASWSWQVGTAAPAPAQITLTGNFDFTTSVSTTGGQWLSVSSTRSGASSTLTLTPDPSALNAGDYSGTVTVTPIVPPSLSGAPAVPTTISVSLTATAAPQISAAGPPCCSFIEFVPNQPAGPPESLTIASNGNPVQVTASASTSSGGNWLKISPASGTTPAQFTVTGDPSGLNLAPGAYSGQIAIQGPSNTVMISVGLRVVAPPQHGTTLQINAPPPAFTLPPDSPQAMGAAAFISFQEFDVVLTSVQSSVSWLTATILNNGSGPPANIQLYPNSIGLSPGQYSGTLTINSSNYPSLIVPVSLTVIPKTTTGPTSITATPTSFTFTAPAGGSSAAQTLSLAIDGGATSLSFGEAPEWLQIQQVQGSSNTAPVYSMTASAANLPPGTYSSSIPITWPGGPLNLPLTFSVTATPSFPPMITAVVDSASALPGALAPGEIISIFGEGIGPAPAGLQLDQSGKVSTIVGQTQVTIAGIPCPLTYVSASQVNAIVPFEAGASGTAPARVIYNGLPSAEWEIPLAAAAPAIFTSNSSGVGQAAALNQDNSANSPSNPAARGTVIQIYATGAGQTQPQPITGALAMSGETLSPAPTVTIGGIIAPVQFAGPAPGEIEGVVQINAIIPTGVAPGASVPVTFSLGGGLSSTNPAAIAVQ